MVCMRCGGYAGGGDNYCRSCGVALRTGLPAPRGTMLPAVRGPRLSPLWGGVALVATGLTLGFLQRRLFPGLGQVTKALPALRSSAAVRQAEERRLPVVESVLVLWRRISPERD